MLLSAGLYPTVFGADDNGYGELFSVNKTAGIPQIR